jgi:hypothetical protein
MSHTRDVMEAAIKAAEKELPPGIGVVLIAFTATGGTANANYISNCERGNARTALKEVLVRWERRDDIIKGILG